MLYVMSVAIVFGSRNGTIEQDTKHFLCNECGDSFRMRRVLDQSVDQDIFYTGSRQDKFRDGNWERPATTIGE